MGFIWDKGALGKKEREFENTNLWPQCRIKTLGQKKEFDKGLDCGEV